MCFRSLCQSQDESFFCWSCAAGGVVVCAVIVEIWKYISGEIQLSFD